LSNGAGITIFDRNTKTPNRVAVVILQLDAHNLPLLRKHEYAYSPVIQQPGSEANISLSSRRLALDIQHRRLSGGTYCIHLPRAVLNGAWLESVTPRETILVLYLDDSRAFSREVSCFRIFEALCSFYLARILESDNTR
jgi:hypothetical protein